MHNLNQQRKSKLPSRASNTWRGIVSVGNGGRGTECLPLFDQTTETLSHNIRKAAGPSHLQGHGAAATGRNATQAFSQLVAARHDMEARMYQERMPAA